MAITASIENYNAINACEDYNNWTGSTPGDVPDFYKEGTQCVGFEMWKSGDNDSYITVTEDLSGTTHLHLWIMLTTLGELNTDANGGIQVYLGDGTNTGYWYVSGSDSYPGGWFNLVVDLSAAVDSGTKPTMTAITVLGVRVNLTTGAKKSQDTWIDNIYTGDGLIIYGDDAGSPFDLDDVLAEDENTTNGWGIIRKIGGVFYANGSLKFGDAAGTGDLDFADQNQILVFEERPVNASLYDIAVVANSTGTTQDFYIGTEAGGRGVSGFTIKAEGTKKYTITITDTDLHNVGIYGCNILDAGNIYFPAYDANYEVLSSSFQQCGVVDPDTCTMKYCNFIGADAAALLIDSASHNVSLCNFIANPHGIDFAISTTVDLDGCLFSGSNGSSLYDAEHSISGALTINAGTVENITTNINSSYIEETGGGSTVVINSVSLLVHVDDQAGDDLQDANVYIEKETDDVYTSTAGNLQGDTDFVVSEALAADVPVSGWLKVFDASLGKNHYYRYASVTPASKTFNLNTKVSGTCEAGGSSTLLNDTGIGAMDVQEGDTIRNETEGSWAVVREVDTNSVTTTALSSGTWANGETWSVHSLAVLYTTSDKAYTPLMNERTDGSGDASASFNYQTGTPILIKVRHSPEAGTKYENFSTRGSIGSGGFSLDVILKEDAIAS